MQSYENCVLAHCKRIYGTKLLYRNHSIYFQTGEEIYRVDLSLSKDKVYCFYNISGTIALIESNLARGFFRIAALPTYKDAGLVPSLADWERFLADAYYYKKTSGGY